MRKIFWMQVSVMLLISKAVFAGCSASPTLQNVPLHFFDHNLGVYTIYLTPTIEAIKNQQTDSGNPYYEKTWLGPCPGGLSGESGSCTEFTVYPDADNFAPGNIMSVIESYTHGKPNRGEVRIITDMDEMHYVYTTDHEKTFCGPYAVSES